MRRRSYRLACCALLVGAVLGATREASGVTAPGSFLLTSPADLAPNAGITPALVWTASTGATSYAVKVCSDPSFTTLVDSATVTTTTHTVAVTLEYDTQYWWSVTASNGAETTIASNNGISFFTTPSGAPTVVSTTPVGGSVTIPAGGISATIRLTPVDDADTEGAEEATFVLLDGAGYDVWSDAEATVVIVDDETPPSAFALDWPPDGAVFLDKDTENFFFWTVSENVLEYDFTIAADASFTQIVHTAVVTEEEYTLDPAVLRATTTYYWRVVASNGVAGTQCASDFTFTTAVDATPPTVVDTSPNADATRVPLTAAITVTFSEPMEVASTEAAVAVSTGGAPVTGTVELSAGGKTLTFTPASDLEKGTVHDVVVAQTAADEAGNPLAESFSFQFETSTPLTIPGCLPGAAPGLRSRGCFGGVGSAAACLLLALAVAASFTGLRRRRVLTRRT